MDEKQVLTLAREALQKGDKATGRRLLGQVLRANPRNETAWLWLSAVVDDPRKREECLERALKLNPASEVAQRELSKLGQISVPSSQAASTPLAPCPYCAEPIREDARLCRYCGRNLVAAKADREPGISARPGSHRDSRPIGSGDITCIVAASVGVFSVVLAPWPSFSTEFHYPTPPAGRRCRDR